MRCCRAGDASCAALATVPVSHPRASLLPAIFLTSQSLNAKYGSNVPLVLMNSFNTDEDTAVVRHISPALVKADAACKPRMPVRSSRLAEAATSWPKMQAYPPLPLWSVATQTTVLTSYCACLLCLLSCPDP